MCATPSHAKRAVTSIEGRTSKWSDFRENGTNRLCTLFFHLCLTPSHTEGVGTSIEREDSKWSDLHKNYANRLCIVSVSTFFISVPPLPTQGGLERL